VRVALGTGDGAILRRADDGTPRDRGLEGVVARITELAKAVIGDDHDRVAAVAMGAAGPLDPKAGVLYDPPNLVPGVVPLGPLLKTSLQLPVFLENDANVAAMGEWRFGGHGKTDNLFYITVSTGVGAGIIADGRLIQGFNATAGEIGHTVIDPNGPVCNCGAHGCVEAFCSGPSIARAARALLAEDGNSLLLDLAGGTIEAVNARTVAEAARRGDPIAVRVFHEAGDKLGIALVNVIHLLSPEIIVVGGGVSQNGELLLEPVRQRIQNTAMKLPARGVQLVTAGLRQDSGLVGALALAIDRSNSSQ
jgi:glucokinase